jgi:transcription initiation factor IIF auxiliary subunit
VRASELSVKVKDTVFDPNLSRSAPKKVHVRREGSTTYYKVWLYLDGEDVPLVDNVTYILHETFRNSERKVKLTPSNPNCQLVIWTWGIFTVKAKIWDKSGTIVEVKHRLTYDQELPPNDDAYDYGDDSLSNGARLVSA